jgi:hypothetical protein
MPLNDTPYRSVTVEEELAALQQAVAEARRHSWTDPDPIEPELENFLAALSSSREGRPNHPDRFFPEDAVRRPRRNAWREVLEDVS